VETIGGKKRYKVNAKSKVAKSKVEIKPFENMKENIKKKKKKKKKKTK